ncbi:transporter substrate-binding domain-containing protein [Paraburkholderia sediminicola]|uniref:transporter substrate-binding domain-containing protein n=1 Tax=Paraburkholderia sediminicola TaxID=458836 RepID=UPI0038B81CD8
MNSILLDQLAPRGVLRAAINLSNPLLVTGRDATGDPAGIAPDLAREIAQRLGVACELVSFNAPHEIADSAEADSWDIGLIGADPVRAQQIAFTAGYVEIEAGYLVAKDTELTDVSAVDRSGVRLAVAAGTAYDLWLTRQIEHATLIRFHTHADAREAFVEQRLEVLAGLKAQLLADTPTLAGSRVLDGRFVAVEQAVGLRRIHREGHAFLSAYIEEAKSGGLIKRLIERHNGLGLRVASAAV